MEQPIIKLWHTSGFGLIIEYPTGVLISNQTGGTACFHPSIEGVYLPIGNDVLVEPDGSISRFHSPENELWAYFTGEKYMGVGATGGLDKDDVIFINQVLAKYHLDFISVDETKLKQSQESWVFVKIVANNELLSLIRNFAKDNEQLTGVITWANSD